MTTAGELSHKVAFEKRGTVTDDYGNEETTFVEQFQTAASLKAKMGGETVTAARLEGQQPVLITVRQSTNADQIKTDWRARDVRSGIIYSIRSIADPDDGGRFWEILTQTGVAS